MIGIFFFLFQILSHLFVETFLTKTASSRPLLATYIDVLLINIYLNQLRDTIATTKCEHILNKCIGFNYLAWVGFTIIMSVSCEACNVSFLTISQLYWHGVTCAFLCLKILIYNRFIRRQTESKFTCKKLFVLVKSNDYYFVFIPLRLYGLFKIFGWFDLI
jgi:hypothetical protein